jgi:hypothetical protein
MANPRHREGQAILIATFGNKVEIVVGVDNVFGPASVGRIGASAFSFGNHCERLWAPVRMTDERRPIRQISGNLEKFQAGRGELTHHAKGRHASSAQADIVRFDSS